MISTADIVERENMAYSVGEYAKQAVSGFRKEITRAEWGRGASLERGLSVGKGFHKSADVPSLLEPPHPSRCRELPFVCIQQGGG
jgi:hypothetical protein